MANQFTSGSISPQILTFITQSGLTSFTEEAVKALSTTIYADVIVPAKKFGIRSYSTQADSPDQTERVQAFLSSLTEGQIGVFPGTGWIRITGNLTVPAGVDLDGGSRLFSTNPNASIPRLRMSPNVTPGGRNTVIRRLQFYRIGMDLSETGTGASSLSDLVFDGVRFSGYLDGSYTSTGADGIIIGNRAYNIHFVNACRINHWASWGIDIRCNAERNGSGASLLATGVNITIGGETKIYNCGSNVGDGYGGMGGALRCIGSPLDSGTIQVQPGALFDTCTSAIWIDNENQSNGGVSGSGGSMVLLASGIRVERCGKLLSDTSPYPTSQPAIFGRRAGMFITGMHGLGFGANIATGNRFIDIRGCHGKIDGIITGVDDANYVVYNDDTHAAFKEFTVDIARSSGKMYQVAEPVYRRDNYTYLEANMVFTFTKTGGTGGDGAGTLAIALQNSNGESIGIGTLSTDPATGFVKQTGGYSVTVGTGKSAITYTLSANAQAFTIAFADRSVTKVTNSYMRRNGNTASLMIDTGVGGGAVSLAWSNNSSQPVDLMAMNNGVQLEFGITVVSVAR